MANTYTKGRNLVTSEVQNTIIEFLKAKGGNVHISEVNEHLLQSKHGVKYENISEVMTNLRKQHRNVIKGDKRGFNKYVEYNEGGLTKWETFIKMNVLESIQ